MELILTESQFRSLTLKLAIDEIATYQKQPFNWGSEHNIYKTSDPNKLIKVGSEESINKWYELFKAHPDIFVKVYKKGKVKHKTNDGNEIVSSYVMVEKLDTRAFKTLWYEFGKAIERYEEQIGQQDHLSVRYYFTKPEEDLDFLINVGISIKNNPQLHEKYLDFLRLMMHIGQLKAIPDIHVDQFGIDSTGKIKCLDI